MVDMSSGPRDPLPVQRALETVGALALVALVVLTLRSGEPVLLAAAVLPTLFLAAGALGGRARPDHRGLQALTAVGACHLAAFALSGLVLGADVTGGSGGTAWVLTLLSHAAFLAGFAALAFVLGCYPDGRVRTRAQRLLLVGVGLACGTSLVVEALLSADAELVVGEGSVAAPGPLPLLATDLDGLALVLLAVVAAVPVLVVSARSLPLESRRSLGWAKLVGVTVGLMLLATPVAAAALPGHLWDGVFIAVVGVAPFLLLAGLVRYRLLAVDLYLVRTAARGVVVVTVLAVYAAASLWSAREAGVGAALVVTVLAAFTGQSVVRRLEHAADRWFNGGRVAHGALARELDRAVASLGTDTDLLPERLCSLVREGLDVSWVRLRDGDLVLAGPVGGPPAEVSVELDAGGQRVGVLECGPRRGGWRRTHRAALDRAAGPVALALRQRRLTQELAARVAELDASRGRLIQAEESARRRVERDLHDGVQQQLVALLATLSVAQAHLAAGGPGGAALQAAHDLALRALEDLRGLVAGIHPPLLGDRGLVAAISARVAPLPLQVDIDVDPRVADVRFPPEVEDAAYFLVSEALTNVMKHSGSQQARVLVAPMESGGLRVAVSDTGSGTASYDGSGLRGLQDRVEALGGRFLLQAAEGVGTTVVGEFGVHDAAVSGV